MYPQPQNPSPKNFTNTELREHACIVAIIRFLDGKLWTMYSRDVQWKNKRTDYRYQNLGHWLTKFKDIIENETPDNWKGRVEEAAIFYNFGGTRGDKILQWSKAKGGWQPR